MSTSTPLPATGPRSRPHNRKKLNDDAAYMAPPSVSASGNKRQATDKADGEPRVKRKRVEAVTASTATNGKKDVEEPQRACLVEFSKLPLSVLYAYMSQHDIIPDINPSPLTSEDPPAPTSLANPPRYSSRGLSSPASTPANRPRRESKEQSRRRSSRLLEEECRSRTPVQADIDELHTVMASIVERHFRDMPIMFPKDEVEILSGFMCAVARSKSLRVSC